MFAAILAGCLVLPLAGHGASGQRNPQGYVATPKSGHGRGVLVLHAWWGLNADVRKLCDRFAETGYVAYAPDLFDGKVVSARGDAEALVKGYMPKEDAEMAKIDVAAKDLERRTGRKEIAVVGLSFGGYYALEYANREPGRVRAVVDFYSTGPNDFHKSRAAYLGHFAQRDEFEPKAGVDATEKALKAAGRPTKFYTYPGTRHWFFEPSVKGTLQQGRFRTRLGAHPGVPARNPLGEDSLTRGNDLGR